MGIEFVPVASVSQVAPDSGIHVAVSDEEIAIFNLGGSFYAIDGICTHGAARLADGYVEGELIECPQHAGMYEIKTGKAVAPPCVIDVKSYPVKVEGETILVGIEREGTS
jgi:nitrite reductase/ring-hydroxylating ferredoxin subunit